MSKKLLRPSATCEVEVESTKRRMPGGELSAERRQREKDKEMQRKRSRELEVQRQQLLRLALANNHARWFREFCQRPDADRMLQKWTDEYEGFEEFMTRALTGDLED